MSRKRKSRSGTYTIYSELLKPKSPHRPWCSFQKRSLITRSTAHRYWESDGIILCNGAQFISDLSFIFKTLNINQSVLDNIRVFLLPFPWSRKHTRDKERVLFVSFIYDDVSSCNSASLSQVQENKVLFSKKNNDKCGARWKSLIPFSFIKNPITCLPTSLDYPIFLYWSHQKLSLIAIQ